MYGKIFGQLLTSSLTQREPIDVRGVFFMLIAAADKKGCVAGIDEAIARVINVPVDIFSRALAALMRPDAESQSPAEGGRRVIRLEPGPGLFLVNYQKYSGIGNDEERRAYLRQKQAECRARKREKAETASTPPKAPKEPDHMYHPDSRTALHWLNEKSGKHFRETDTNLAIISNRLKEQGVDIAGIKTMIDRQCKRWLGTDQAEYLRPETLFGKTKFDSYYAAKDQPYATHQSRNKQNTDRNVGTLNEGRAADYEGVGKVG